MKTGTDFQKALEQAMADHDMRMLHFTTPFGIEANTQACKALTAPVLNEIYGIGATTASPALKRPAPEIGEGTTQATEKTPLAKKRARQQANKKAKAAEEKAAKGAGAARAALPPPPLAPHLAIEDRRDRKGQWKGADKGTGKGSKATLPRGIRLKTEVGRLVSYSYIKGERCVEEPCRFEHVCCWCHAVHVVGAARTAACSGGG